MPAGSSRSNRSLAAALGLSAALVALFTLPRPPWGSPHYGELLILVVAAARARDLRDAWNELPSAAHVLLLVLSLSTGVALLAGRVPPLAAALVLLRTAEGLIVLAIARARPFEPGPALWIGASIAAAIGIGEVLLTPPPLIPRAFETWSFGEANHFAGLLALAAVVLVSRRPAAVPLLLLALLFTGSRTAFLACAAGLFATGHRRVVVALLALAAAALVLHPQALFDRDLLFGADRVASPHAPRWQTWRILLPAEGPLDLLLGRGAGFVPHRFYEAEWVRLWVEGGGLALVAAGALGAALLSQGKNRPVLITLLFLSLGMNVLLIGRVAIVGALLLGAAPSEEPVS